MARALELARRGQFTTKPNPMVGCVIVRDQDIIAEGWHERAGAAHAEINALEAAGDAAHGAEAFVTLEPCSHTGRTGPCAEALINAGIGRVIAAMEDPNPKVAGTGLARLRDAGIDVTVGVGAETAAKLNAGFVKRMAHGTPRLRVKLAASMDGRTAASDGSSQWITCAEARADVHRLRAASCAVITGIGTVTADNPRLNARLAEAVVQPLRVVIDGKAQLDPNAALFSVEGSVLVVTASQEDDDGYGFDARTELISLIGSDNRVDLAALMDHLGQRCCNEVLLEAGAGVAGAFVSAGLIDELVVYLAPDLLGSGGRGMFVLRGIGSLSNRICFEISDVQQLGRDLRVTLQPKSGAE
jgi:diaminohydroxyphosphoribosylaminopyrimidine deaminase/5-amino-6-(5-phosphoribosylamino)uracil reductase